MGVLVGFSTSSISRLRKSWAIVPEIDKDMYRTLENMMSPEKSFSAYRNHLSTASSPCVPFLAVYLSDLTFIDEGNQDIIENKINFEKIDLIYEVFKKIYLYQQDSYRKLRRLEPLASYLEALPRFNENELYNLSNWLEPKEQIASIPPVYTMGSYSALHAKGFSPSQIAEIIDLIVDAHLTDPRWIYMYPKDVAKRRKMMLGIIGAAIRWCSKHTDHILVKYEQNDNPNATKKFCAVTIWLSPGTVIDVPFETVALEAAKTMLRLGTKTAARAKALISDLWEFINCCAGQGTPYWELIYVGVLPSYLYKREYWEEVVYRIFIQVDKLKQPSYCFTTDPAKKEMLENWGFKVKREGLLSKQVTIWGLVREPWISQ